MKFKIFFNSYFNFSVSTSRGKGKRAALKDFQVERRRQQRAENLQAGSSQGEKLSQIDMQQGVCGRQLVCRGWTFHLPSYSSPLEKFAERKGQQGKEEKHALTNPCDQTVLKTNIAIRLEEFHILRLKEYSKIPDTIFHWVFFKPE